VLRDVTPENPGWCYTSAWALLGFLRHRRGDVVGAQQAWQEGLRVEWHTPWYGFRLTEGLILASLSGEFSKSDAQILVKRGLRWVPAALSDSLRVHSLIPLEDITSVLRDTYRNPRGWDYSRKIVFREIPFADCRRLPPTLIALEAIRQGADLEEMSDELDALVWQFVCEAYTAVCETGDISKEQLFALAMTWTGAPGAMLLWSGVVPALAPRLRGPIAYVMGHRYLSLERPAQAAMFFQTALEDAPAGSPLESLVQTELDRLSASIKPSSGAKR
jgi:hypothetical protein